MKLIKRGRKRRSIGDASADLGEVALDAAVVLWVVRLIAAFSLGYLATLVYRILVPVSSVRSHH